MSKTNSSQTPTDKNIQTSDVTNNNASTSKHGFVLKGTNTGTKFLRDDLTWQTPPGGGTGATTGQLVMTMQKRIFPLFTN